MNVARRYPIFLQMATFTRAWEHFGLNDEALKVLEDEILLNPNAGKVIQGTGGPKTTINKGGMNKAKGTRRATPQRASKQLSVPQQILEGLREMSEFATSGEPPEKRYTVRQLTLDLEPGDYTPDKVRATRAVFGLSQPLFAKFLGVEVSALRHWEQGIRSPSAVVRRFLDEMNATPDHWSGRIEAAVRRTQEEARGKR
jgi:DNA-binding transcriptional regulator YiaG